ncbi:MAG: oligosaccharide flippase family protein [Clostridia bacterium]|nr:oligosaccharide flippase family protein [Clostridia bacterium]
MKSKSITKNYIYNLIYQVLILILPLITTPYVSRVLGAENLGIYSYTTSISAYFILFGSLGIALYGQREIAYKQSDKKAYSRIFWEVLILRFITMFISLAIFYFIFISRE